MKITLEADHSFRICSKRVSLLYPTESTSLLTQFLALITRSEAYYMVYGSYNRIKTGVLDKI